MKKYFKGLKELRLGVLIFIGGCSLFISWWTLRIPVNNKIRSLLPEYTCIIKVLDEQNNQAGLNYEVWIEGLRLGNTEGVFENSAKIFKNEGFELRKAEEFGYSSDVIVNTQGAGSELTIRWGGGFEDSITFWRQSFSGIVLIDITFGENVILQEKVDLFSNQPDDRLIYSLNTPLNETIAPKEYVMVKWCIYFFVAIVCFFILSFLLVKVIEKKEN